MRPGVIGAYLFGSGYVSVFCVWLLQQTHCMDLGGVEKMESAVCRERVKGVAVAAGSCAIAARSARRKHGCSEALTVKPVPCT